MGAYGTEGLQCRGRGGVGLNTLVDGLLPNPSVALGATLVAVALGSAGATLATLVRRRGVRVAYTRKIFHIVIFTAAAGVHTLWALPGTLVFGVVIAGMVLAAVAAGDGQPFYEALARETDEPHRTLFILLPLITTAIGGLVSAVVAGPYASVGYLAAGWGDAAGEPVGARWGRHRYRVPSLAGVAATRTLEGSAAVFVVASAASMLALGALGAGDATWWAGLACGGAAAAVEAVSHHGLDNLTVQVVASLVASWLLA